MGKKRLKYYRMFGTFMPLVGAVCVVIIGTAGYMLIEGWSLVDSVYMSVITLSTVGFGEIYPLSATGRLFTVFLVINGVGVAAYAFSHGASLVLDPHRRAYRELKRMEKKISALNGHTIVCGYGRLGPLVVDALVKNERPVVVIDSREETVFALEGEGVLCVQGRAEEDACLLRAGVLKSSALLSLLPSDADNVYVTLSARALNPGLRIIARTEVEPGENKLRRAGADDVVFPYRVSASKIVQNILKPSVTNFLELESARHKEVVVEEIKIQPGSALVNKPLAESPLRNVPGMVVAALIRENGEFIWDPDPSTKLESNITVIAVGEIDAVQRLSESI